MLRVFIRNKSSKVGINTSTHKVVGQLSVISANRKQPKLLNLCAEDLVKHRSIQNAWKLFGQRQHKKKETQLKLQYDSIFNAMEDLKQTSPELYKLANAPQPKKKWPLELRVPTDFPANKPWIHEFTPYQK